MCFRKHWVAQDIIIINLLDAMPLSMDNLSSVFKKEDNLLQNLSDQQLFSYVYFKKPKKEDNFL